MVFSAGESSNFSSCNQLERESSAVSSRSLSRIRASSCSNCHNSACRQHRLVGQNHPSGSSVTVSGRVLRSQLCYKCRRVQRTSMSHTVLAVPVFGPQQHVRAKNELKGGIDMKTAKRMKDIALMHYITFD